MNQYLIRITSLILKIIFLLTILLTTLPLTAHACIMSRVTLRVGSRLPLHDIVRDIVDDSRGMRINCTRNTHVKTVNEPNRSVLRAHAYACGNRKHTVYGNVSACNTLKTSAVALPVAVASVYLSIGM